MKQLMFAWLALLVTLGSVAFDSSVQASAVFHDVDSLLRQQSGSISGHVYTHDGVTPRQVRGERLRSRLWRLDVRWMVRDRRA